MERIITIILFLYIIPVIGIGQSYKHEVIPLGDELGLNGKIKHQLHFDKRGFLWMASSYGVDRYDGKEIIAVKGIEKTIASNLILEIYETKDSVLVLISGMNSIKKNPVVIDSIIFIQPETGNIIPQERYLPEGMPFTYNEIGSITRSNSNLNFMLKTGDIYEFDGEFRRLGKIKYFEDHINYQKNWLISKEGHICKFVPNNKIATSKGKRLLGLFDFEGNLLKQIEIQQKQAYLNQADDGNYHIIQINDNHYTGVIIDADFKSISQISKDYYSLYFGSTRSDGNSYFESDSGIQIQDVSGAHLATIDTAFISRFSGGYNRIEKRFSLSGADFFCYQTKDIPIIVSSFQTPFQNYLNHERKGLSIRGICTNDNGIIVANSGTNVHIIDSNSGNIRKLNLKIPTDNVYMNLWKNYYDSEKDIFWITSNGRISSVNINTNNIIPYPAPVGINIKSIMSVGSQNKLVSSSNKGLYQIDVDSNSLVPLQIGPADHPINNEEISFIKDGSEKVLLCTRSNFYHWSIDNNEIELFKSLPDTLIDANVLDYLFDVNDVVWMATTGLGVAKWDMANNKLTFYNMKDGLSNNVVYSIQAGKDGKLWIPTSYGLNSLDPVSMTNNIYLVEDGLPGYEFNNTSFHQDKNGILYFGGLNGFTRFDPDDISLLKQKDPPTYISGILIKSPNEDSPKSVPINKNDFIKLERNETLTVKYSSPNVVNKLPILYQYKYEGENSSWIDHSNGSLSLSSLSPGDHHLKIRGRGIHKAWSDKEASLLIRVPTPYFLSTWFYLILCSIFGIGGYIYYRRRIYSLEKSRIKLKHEVDKRTQSIQESKEVIQKQTQDLKHLDELKSQFFTNVSHELRTPLTLIANPLNELKKTPLNESPNQREFVETALSGSKQLNSIVEKILKLADYDSNTFLLNNQEVSFHNIILKAIEPAYSFAATNGINIELELFSPRLNIITIDEEKIVECIENLLSNAIKYSPVNSTIHLQMGYKNKQFFFSAKDNGIGMTKDEISKIYSIYYQGDKKGLPEQGGLGIGLSIVSAYLKLMNGQINVDSQVDSGSTFTITIPCPMKESTGSIPISESERHPIDNDEKKPAIISTEKPIILVIEDNVLMNKLIQNILSPQYHVISANNGHEALLFLAEKDAIVDLILTDWMMPIMDGKTFYGKVKSNELWKNTPTIMVSARASEDDRLNSLRVGIDDYLTKPFVPEELKIRIENLLRFSKQRKQEEKNIDPAVEIEFDKEVSADDIWLEKLKNTTSKSMKDFQFSVSIMAEEMNLSSRQLTRKVKQLTGLTPGNYLKEIRLLKARHLLEEKKYNTVAEVCYATGFASPDYFSKLFIKRFGKQPSQYLKN